MIRSRKFAFFAVLVLSCFAAVGADAAFFVDCLPSTATINIRTTNVPRQFIIDYSIKCGAGAANSCCVVYGGVAETWNPATSSWVNPFNFATTSTGNPCGGTTIAKQTKVDAYGPGLYRVSAFVKTCDLTTTIASAGPVQWNFP